MPRGAFETLRGCSYVILYQSLFLYRKCADNLSIKLLDSKCIVSCNAVAGVIAVCIELSLICERILIFVSYILKNEESISKLSFAVFISITENSFS